MANIEFIPLLSEPAFEFSVSLSGTLVFFKVRWNSKMSTWMASASLQDGTPIFQSRKMLPWFNLFDGIAVPHLVTGKLSLSRTGYKIGDLPPSEENLSEWVLVYEF